MIRVSCYELRAWDQESRQLSSLSLQALPGRPPRIATRNVRRPLQLLRPALGEFFKKNLGTSQSDRAALFQSGEGVAGAGDVG